MNELLSIIKLKDKITIISLMVAFAAILATTIGLITQGTVDPHEHTYEYHLERVGEEKFAVVGVCTDKSCEDPKASWDVQSLSETIVTNPTCCTPGNTRYVLTTNVLEGEIKSYILDEPIAKLPHNYVGALKTSESGATSIEAVCTNKECTSALLKIENVADANLKLEETKDATCNSDRYQKYTYTANGISSTVEIYVEENIAHTLNGKYVTEYMVDGYIPYGTEGVKLDGANSLGCGESAKGSYVCQVCQETQTVNVSKANHTYEIDKNKTVLPTLSTNGSAYIWCYDCGKSATIVLPKIVVGSNADVISQDADKEIQTVKYNYFNDNNKYEFVAEIVIPWENHVFEYTQDDVVYPTLNSDGSLTLRCKNSACSKEIVLTLPAMKVGANTTLVSDHILEKQTYTYTYTNSEYQIELTHSYDVAWISHTYVLAENETVNPTLDSDGKAYVRCSYEGCDKHYEITIPKIQFGVNVTNVSDATELAAAVVRYTYSNSEHGFVVSFDFEVGEPLSHNYKYKIELNIFTGNFDFVGKCDQPGCATPELREENIDVIMEEVLPTCTTDGSLTVKYEKDGVLYEMTMRNGNRTGHNYVESNKVEPTLYSDGSVTLTCSNEGCGKSGNLTLPMMVFNENTYVLTDVSEQSPVVMRYTYIDKRFEYVLVIDFTMGEALSHDYKYELVYNESTDAYDFVGVCNQPGCATPELREENVDVTIEEHKADCTTDGYIYVIYMKDGTVYSLTIPTNTKAGHNYDVDNPVSLTKPTWDNDGSVTVECTNEGCGHTATVVLPKCENDVTVFEYEQGTVYYLYTDEETGYEIFFIIKM